MVVFISAPHSRMGKGRGQGFSQIILARCRQVVIISIQHS